MAQVRGERYLSVYESHRSTALCTVERQKFGFDHSDVGARMLEQWQFSEETVEAVRHHHHESATQPMAIATQGGAILAETIWSEDIDEIHKCRDWIDTNVGIGANEFSKLVRHCQKEVTLELDIYGIAPVQEVDCESLIEEARRQFLNTSIHSAVDLDDVESALNGCR